MALDAAIEDGSVPTGNAAALSTDSLRAKINWASPQAYARPVPRPTAATSSRSAPAR